MEATTKVAGEPKMVVGETQGNIQTESDTVVALSSLSEMTGFPIDFIKSELLVDNDELSMDDLRKTMASYLEHTLKQEVQ
ncbi:MAG: hypothetical protein VXV96_03695 [Bdellovibrionota bacterium]|jgi:hypothetical protein|nr:hypothetical protein [Bdellovibrionota bacterium]